LALPNSPVPQGEDLYDSKLDFLNWIKACAVLVPGGTEARNHAGIYGSHHLNLEQKHSICFDRWLVIPRVLQIRANQLSGFAHVLEMTGLGEVKSRLTIVSNIFL
jgi:hypothetical protein